MKKIIPLITLLLFPMTGYAQDPPQKTEIRILVPASTSSLPFFLLEERQSLDQATIKVETFAQHAQALIKLIRGDADFLLTGTTQGWQSIWDGSPLVAVGSYVWGVSSLVARPDGPRSLAELKGKTVSLPFPNSPLDVKTRYLLARAGLTVGRDLTIEYRPFAQALPLLKSGAIDAVALPEPLASNLVHTEQLIRLFEYRTAWGDAVSGDGLSPEVTLYTTGGTASRLHGLIISLDEEIGRMIDFILDHKKELAVRYSPQFAIPAGILEEAIAKTSFWSCDFQTHKQKITEYLDQVRAYFSVPPPKLPESSFFAP